MPIKTSGFNIQDIEKENMDSAIHLGEQNIEKELKLKKKKFNFDNIFPTPKVDKCMGLCDIKSDNYNPFKELLK